MSERRRGQAGDLPMSSAQEQLWFIHEYNNAHPVLNAPVMVWLRGALDVAALGRALDGVVARHEVLRSRLAPGGDGRAAAGGGPPGGGSGPGGGPSRGWGPRGPRWGCV